MNSKDLVAHYLTDNEDGMKNLITWFLNEVMQKEALEQVGAAKYERTGTRRKYRNDTRCRTLKSRYGPLNLETHYCGISPSRHGFLKDTHGSKRHLRMPSLNRTYRESQRGRLRM